MWQKCHSESERRLVGCRACWPACQQGCHRYWASGKNRPAICRPRTWSGETQGSSRPTKSHNTRGALMPCIIRKRSGLLSSAAFATSALAFAAVSLTSPLDVAFAQGAACGTQATAAGGAITLVEQGQTFGVTTNTSCGNLSTAGTAGTVDATAVGASSNAGAGAIAVGHRAEALGLRRGAIGTDARA